VEAVAGAISPERRAEAAGRLAFYARRLEEMRQSSVLANRPLEALIEDIRALNQP
jgi:hypothetical protein